MEDATKDASCRPRCCKEQSRRLHSFDRAAPVGAEQPLARPAADEGAVRLNFHHKRRAFAENEIPPVTPCQQGKSLPAALERLHKSLVFHLVERICSCGRERRSRGDYRPSHGVFPVKLIRLGRPLACHPRSGAKRSGAGSEATLTRRRPATLSGASAPLRALGCLCGLCRTHSFWHCVSFAFWPCVSFAFGSEA